MKRACHRRQETRTGPGQQYPRTSRSSWWHVVLLVLCGGVLYANAFDGPFTFDDTHAIVTNPSIRQLWPPWAMLSPPIDTPVAGRPLVNATFALNYALGGLDVRGYHIVNDGLHILCALLVLVLIRRTLESPPLGDRFSRSASGLALASALIWEVHALNTEAVNYVTQRTELLVSLFYLLTLYCALRGSGTPPVPVPRCDEPHPYRRGTGTGGVPDPRIPPVPVPRYDQPRRCGTGTGTGGVPDPRGHDAAWILGSVMACALGMASKEVMVTAPIAVVLHDVAFSGQAMPILWKKRRGLYLGLASTWIILIGLLLPGPRSATVGISSEVSPLSYFASQSVSVLTYLKLSVWPWPLVLHYGNATNVSIAQVWPYAVPAVALLVGVVWVFTRKPALGFAGVWFFLILAPTSSVVPIVTEVTAERRMYLPLVSVVAVAVTAVWLLLRRVGAGLAIIRSLESADRGRYGSFSTVKLFSCLLSSVSCLLVLLTVGLLGSLTMARNAEFSSEVSIWQTVVERRPENPGGHINLGVGLTLAGRSEDAIDHYRRGLALSPDEATAWTGHFNLGQELFRREQWNEALEQLRRSLERTPEHPTVHYLMGQILAKQGQIEEAVKHYRAALRTRPAFPEAQTALATSLTVLGRTVEAISLYRAVLENRADDVELRGALGTALALDGRFNDAIAEYQKALARQPDNLELHVRLGLAYAALGESDEAAEWYRRAIRRRADYVDAHYHLGNVLVGNGAMGEAIEHYQQAVRIQPEHAEAQFNLAVALVSSGRSSEALAHAREAQRLRPDEPRISRLLADLAGQRPKGSAR